MNDYNNSIKYGTDNEFAYYNRGLLKYIMKNYDDAIVDYTTAINLNRQSDHFSGE